MVLKYDEIFEKSVLGTYNGYINYRQSRQRKIRALSSILERLITFPKENIKSENLP